MMERFGVPPARYRLPSEARCGHVRLQVSRLEGSLPFYQQLLGLAAVERVASVAALGAGGARVPLVELHERNGVRPLRPHGRLGLYHFALRVPDRASLARFVRHLAEQRVVAAMADHDVSESIYLTDPDGLGIEVYADRPRDQWRVAGREVVATTVRLDVASLLGEAGDASWTGMPAATTMGHVHFHVGDLEAASRFYHEGLGFDRTITSYPGALFVAAGGYHHHVGLNTWASGARPAGPDDARLLEWNLVVPAATDVAAVAASLGEAGATTRTDGAARTATDPWGITVRVRAAV